MIIEQLIDKISNFKIELISQENIKDVMDIMTSNVYYYSKIQKCEITLKGCLEDIVKLPPNVDINNKIISK